MLFNVTLGHGQYIVVSRTNFKGYQCLIILYQLVWNFFWLHLFNIGDKFSILIYRPVGRLRLIAGDAYGTGTSFLEIDQR